VLSSQDAELEQSQAVAPEDFIEADGRCAGAPPSAVAAAPNAGAASVEASGSAAAGPAGEAPAQPLLGGVALGMTECQVARRAGQPASVEIGAGEEGERKVVLTYPTGSWPGIYTFRAGRLKEIQRVAAPEPVKPLRKRKAPSRAAR
jgi:hypothetical protein